MTTLPAWAPLVAQISRWERLGDGFRTTGRRLDVADFLPLAIGLAVVAAVVVGIVHWKRRNDMSQRCNDPEKLFRELCMTHEIDGPARRLLRRLAEFNGLDHPSKVFLTPDIFSDQRIPDELADQRSELKGLRYRLF